MKYDIIITGGGAAGLMAAYSAASAAAEAGLGVRICVLEKMPRPGRKIMITGKGRCNFTNAKGWNDFSRHIRSNPRLVRAAFHTLPPEKVMGFFASYGVPSVVERGDRAFPQSYRASDIVDALVTACTGMGVKIEGGFEVARIAAGDIFTVSSADGRSHSCSRLIIATGGLSYPGTGSTGDGLKWAEELGHGIIPVFPSLTALVPKGYKEYGGKGHIPRETPLSDSGRQLCGIQLKNIGLQLIVEGTQAGEEFGDIDFTDGGIEGPVGFQLSRKAVKSMIGGSRVRLVLDLKPGVSLEQLSGRIEALWDEISKDPRSRGVRDKERCRILLGKLMPRELIPAFRDAHPEIIATERRGGKGTAVRINLAGIARALKGWSFEIAGYVGWERAVITAGGVSADSVFPKTLESRTVPGLYFCGEVLDTDADTGGYNLQLAFCTGALSGISAAKGLRTASRPDLSSPDRR